MARALRRCGAGPEPIRRFSTSRQGRKAPPKGARNAVRWHPPIAAPPWSCRCPAVPRRSANPACASPACASARRPAQGYDPVRRHPTACADAICPAADAARPAPFLPPRTGFELRVVVSCSSAERHVDLLAAAHDRDAPKPGRIMRRLFKAAGPGDLLAVDRQDDIALLESDIGS